MINWNSLHFTVVLYVYQLAIVTANVCICGGKMCEKIHAIDGMGNFIFLSILLVDDYHDHQFTLCPCSQDLG